jgi:hypothetical protein
MDKPATNISEQAEKEDAEKDLTDYKLWQTVFYVGCVVMMAPRINYWSIVKVNENFSTLQNDTYAQAATQSWILTQEEKIVSNQTLWILCMIFAGYCLLDRLYRWKYKLNDVFLLFHDLITIGLLWQSRYMPQHVSCFLFVHSIHDVGDVFLDLFRWQVHKHRQSIHGTWVWILPILWFITRIVLFGCYILAAYETHKYYWIVIELSCLWVLHVAWLYMIIVYIFKWRKNAKED